MSSNEVFLGKIIGVFGVKGWVKIYSYCRPKEDIFKYQKFYAYLNSQKIELNLLAFQKQQQGLIASFKEINDRDRALSFKDSELFISKEQLPKLENNEVYWQDLIGLKVFNLQNLQLGIVKELFENPKNDILVVDNQENEILIPFIRGVFIEKIDLEAQKIIVNWQADW